MQSRQEVDGERSSCIRIVSAVLGAASCNGKWSEDIIARVVERLGTTMTMSVVVALCICIPGLPDGVAKGSGIVMQKDQQQ